MTSRPTFVATCAPVVAAVAVGCASFEDPAILLDLRVVAMTAHPPEQVLDVDLANPPPLGALLDQLQPSFVCAELADPGTTRALRWSLTACLPDNGRCDPTRPTVALGDGVIPDPDLAPTPLCVEIAPDAGLLAILRDQLELDPFHGFAGLDYAIELRVGGVDDDPADDQFALKQLRVAARLPADRVANENPGLSELQLSLNEFEGDPALIARCAALDVAPFAVRAGTRVRLFPLEAADSREAYFVPTVDGEFRSFTETLGYQWLATAGSFSANTTGGPVDPFGNPPALGSSWFAPAVAQPVDVQLWVVQRDERFGVSAYPTCIRVTP